ncbi:SAM-dependent methyltransferase [Microbacter margulisiae]|uniref:16S rRNA (Cytidine1402-2'-O)-methyltransferase n=1 Tax=Microbacter margulisiae TaxID=1350067 RepID=A0A7W5H200_9PORP|nr:SAM-dependent methyltransferase [Microbacter margulisiae]MBB3186902.1 16S rRNA (cytidine1402-2'-O)-methyltransferase [Microbacter margulisiae]
MKGTLYMLPTTLGDVDLRVVLPDYNLEIINRLTHFIVEDVRTARRFLKKVNSKIDIDALTFLILNEQTQEKELPALLQPLKEGHDVGVLSEAGCPAVADPGADIVRLAQLEGIRVVPLVGPSSLLMALMASGFNGQNFAFVGYLPIAFDKRVKALKILEKRAITENQTQIFIETPYRNIKLMEEMVEHLQPATHLCVAVDISIPTESILTKSVAAWRKALPDIQKKPTVFLINK